MKQNTVKKSGDRVVELKLKDISVDEVLVDLRPPKEGTVSRYRRAMRFDGIDGFPLMYIDEKTRKIVSGNQRYVAMLREFGEDFTIYVKMRSYADRLQLVEHAVTENMKFGRQLDGFEAKRFRNYLYQLNAPEERIASLFNKSTKAIKSERSGLVVVVAGKKKRFKGKRIKVAEDKNGIKTERLEPVKRSVPECVTDTTEEQYDEMVTKDIGVKLPLLADQIIRHLNNDWVDNSYKNILRELCSLLIKKGYGPKAK